MTVRKVVNSNDWTVRIFKANTLKVLTVCFFTLLMIGCAAEAPKQVAKIKRYVFWPDAPDLPRIQYLCSYSTSLDVEAQEKKGGLSSLVFGEENKAEVPMTKPYGVAIWNGRIYVTDVRGQGVMVLDIKNHQARIMGASGAGAISKATDVAVTSDGFKYVTDPNRNSVLVFDANERFDHSINVPCSPVSIAAGEKELYVCGYKVTDTTRTYAIYVIDRQSDKILRTIGKQGGEDGQFVMPLGISLDPQGNIIVGDLVRDRIQKFSPDGKLLQAFGEAGNRPGNISKPKHVRVASDGLTYVVDAAFYNVQIFDEQGMVLMYFGGPGGHPGSMNLPAGIAISDSEIDTFKDYIHPNFQAERIIVVTNQFGPTRVSVYAMGHLREGKTLADIAGGRSSGETKIPGMSPTVVPAAASQPAGATTQSVDP